MLQGNALTAAVVTGLATGIAFIVVFAILAPVLPPASNIQVLGSFTNPANETAIDGAKTTSIARAFLYLYPKANVSLASGSLIYNQSTNGSSTVGFEEYVPYIAYHDIKTGGILNPSGIPFDNSTGNVTASNYERMRLSMTLILSVRVNHTGGVWQPVSSDYDCISQGSFGSIGGGGATHSYANEPYNGYDTAAIQELKNYDCLPTDPQWYK